MNGPVASRDPVSVLRDVLLDIENGIIDPHSVVVLIEHKVGNEQVIPAQFVSPMGNADLIARLEVAKVQTLQRWLGPIWAGEPSS